MNIKEFIKGKVMLKDNQWQKIKKEYSFFKEELEQYLKTSEFQGLVTRQGSVSTRTVIRPLDSEDQFDLDIVLMLDIEDESLMIQKANEIKQLLAKKYNGIIGKIAFKTKSGSLDIDLVPMFGKLGHHQKVVDTTTNKIIKSNNLNIRDDFNDHSKDSRVNQDNALREAVMLMKYSLQEHDVKGVPSVVIGILAQTATEGTNYTQQVINHLVAVANGLKDSWYVHNPSNYEHITFENGSVAAQIILDLVDAVAKNDSKLLQKVLASSTGFFATVTGVATTTTAGSIAGGSTNFACEKENI